MALLPIYSIYDQQDWERDGYSKEYLWGLMKSVECTLLPFVLPNVPTDAGNLIAEFTQKQVQIKNGIKTTLREVAMVTTKILKKTGSTYDTFYFPATDETLQARPTGLYEFYIKTDNGEEFMSELFKVEGCSTYAIAGDWNNDWNNDFNIGSGC